MFQRRTIGGRSKRIALAVIATAAVAGAGAAPALAVTGCTGVGSGTCVDAATGGKNYSNHTQWVGTVTARDYGGSYTTKLESWGDGFYFAAGFNGAWGNRQVTWTVNRWVRSGTNICGASTSQGYRDIACIAIRV
jgi:hypothetical protein